MSSWETRELPVLRAAQRLLADGGTEVTATDLSRATGLPEDDVVASLRVLAEAHGPYVTGHGLLAAHGEPAITELTSRAEQEIARADYTQARERSDEPGSVPIPGHPMPPGAVPR
ncbi:MAG TPA: hypothetical protein VK908_18045 [Jiangellales bacterium]|nr:hypothetical protein [Jiangellales bacterium]